MKHIHVAAGVVINAESKILVAHRPAHVDQPNLWEFPGGKIEAGETPYDALCRELHEELKIIVNSAKSLITLTHDYPAYRVTLHVFTVNQFEGEPHGALGQAVRWVTKAELVKLEFPQANYSIIELI